MSETPPRERATVRRVWTETERLTGVVLEVSAEVAAKYTKPGQFIVLYPPGSTKRVYLVIASAPGEARALELLLGEAARRDLDVTEGATYEMDPPSGNGFPMEIAEGHDVLLFAIGSGLAALRPVIDVIRNRRDNFGRVTLYAGAHTERDFPYAGHFEEWKRDRVEIVRAISKPWVQDLFESSKPSVENASAFVVGTKQMMDDVTAVLVRAGIPLGSHPPQLVIEMTSADEVRRIRSGAALVARPEVKTLELTGPDRGRFLNGMVSNEVASLAPGQGVLAVKTSNKGRVEALVRVRAGEASLFIDLDANVADVIRATLDQFIIMDDCAIADVSASREVVSVFGAGAVEVLARAGLDPGDVQEHGFIERDGITIIRDATLQLPGWELHTKDAAALLARLESAGAVRVSAEALDVARIEAGAPVDGRDLDTETFPMEARLEHALSLTKGCYVGQEVIARATNFGGVKHILTGLIVDGDAVPEEGAPLFAGEARTGELTSVARSPTLGRTIALAYVRRTEEAPGTKLEIASERAGRLGATVTELPFVR